MADEKKPAPEKDPFVEIVSALFVLMIVVYALNSLVTAVTTSRLFSNGWEGLTSRGILLNHTRPIASLVNAIGANVVVMEDSTDVYGSPGGNKVGEQKFNSRGVILQGPVIIDGERYWYVDFEEDPDGWVRESDIAYLESEPNWLEKIVINIFNIYWYLKLLAILLSILGVIAIVYLFRHISELRENEAKLLYPQRVLQTTSVNPQWERVLTHVESLNENDWRLAILEADIMLGDILDRLSLPGDTIGEKLKAVEKSDFTTVDNAWEAHKVRNQIAHEGSSFDLNQRRAREIIDLYRTVFEEFHII